MREREREKNSAFKFINRETKARTAIARDLSVQGGVEVY